jgi:hypothetical protein
MSDDEMVSVSRSEWAALLARVALLESRSEATVAPGVVPSGTDVSAGRSTDRRGLLKQGAKLAAGAVVGGAALVAAQAGPADANTGAMMYGAVNTSGSDSTALSSTNSSETLLVSNLGLGNGVSATSFSPSAAVRGQNNNGGGPGVEGVGFLGAGVHGYVGTGADPAVHAEAGPGGGPALLAEITDSLNSATAAQSTTVGTGSAMSAEITNASNAQPAFFASTQGTGYGVWAQQLGGSVAALYGDCSLSGGDGVLGVASGSGAAGVHGQSEFGPGAVGECLQSANTSPAVSGTTVGTGQAVLGKINNAASSASAVQGVTNGTGSGVYGQIMNAANSFPAVTGVTNGSGAAVGGVATGTGPALAGLVFGGTGPAIQGGILNPGNGNPGVAATTNGTGAAIQGQASGAGTGVNASSINGRGAILYGGAAPLQLVPGRTSSHPSSGLAGDFYVDNTNRLWFCTVTGSPATWKQLA